MKVFLALEGVVREGSWIIGVFSTREKAEQYIELAKERKKEMFKRISDLDYFDIEEREIDTGSYDR